jgi:hypothetical protein
MQELFARAPFVRNGEMLEVQCAERRGGDGGAADVLGLASQPALHVVLLDGVYREDGVELTWQPLGLLQTREVGEVLERVVGRMADTFVADASSPPTRTVHDLVYAHRDHPLLPGEPMRSRNDVRDGPRRQVPRWDVEASSSKSRSMWSSLKR